MSSRARLYGRWVYKDKLLGFWRYEDDGEIFKLDGCRPCLSCNLNPKDTNGHDPCLGELPGIKGACCGHGVKRGYLCFENGVTLVGDFRRWNRPGDRGGKIDMRDLIAKIKAAQISAREEAAIRGASFGEIQLAGVQAAEQMVIDDLRRMEVIVVATKKPE